MQSNKFDSIIADKPCYCYDFEGVNNVIHHQMVPVQTVLLRDVHNIPNQKYSYLTYF